MNVAASCRHPFVLATVALFVAVAAGCGSFGAAPDASDGGTPATSGVACGTTRCPAPQVCCFDPQTKTEACAASVASCTGAALACKTTSDCRVAGAAPETVCCLHNDVMNLTYSVCVASTQCDASGPQDWLCTMTAGRSPDCTDDARPVCKRFELYPSPRDVTYCASP